MRLSLIAAASFALVVSSPMAAFSQDLDFSPISDLDAAGPEKTATRPKAAQEGGDSQKRAETEPNPKNSVFDRVDVHGTYDPVTRTGSQSKPVLPATLAQALAQALQANPDVLLAEAKVRQAQAEYNQAKLKAAQDVTVAFHERGAAQRSLETHREARMKIPGSVPEPEIQRLADELAECEAKMTYLLGAGAELKQAEPSDRKETIQLIPHPIRILHENRAVSDATANQDAGKQTPRVVLEPLEKVGTLHVASHPGSGAPAGKRPGIPEKYRKVLQKPVKVKFKDMNVDQIVEQLNRLTGDELPILLPRQQFGAAPLTIELPKEVSLQTALEAVADMSECAFLFRDYGLLVVNRSFVPNYPPSATIPELP